MTVEFFCPCPRGLETLLQQELLALGGEAVDAIPGGVQGRCSLETIQAFNLCARLPTRVLIRVATAPYSTDQDIYEIAREVIWEDWFSVHHTFRVSVTAQSCPLQSLNFITLRIKDAVCDGFRDSCNERPSIDTHTPDIRIQAFLDPEKIQLYVDTSGEPLYKRGYKVAPHEAPLKENLAAGIIQLTEWQPEQPLFDPMCGSGSFVLEAAQYALNMAPGLRRHFACEKLIPFNQKHMQTLRKEAEDKILRDHALHIYANDIDEASVTATRANLKSLGLETHIQVTQHNLIDLDPPCLSGGVLLANPPYGVRLSDEELLSELYPLLGTTFKQRYVGWQCALFSADTRLPKLIRLQPARKIPLFNGPLECRLYRFNIVEGVHRPRSTQMIG